MADERDDDISRRYRELGAEEPPRELDNAIIGAARRAVTKRSRFYPLAAVAAVAVFAVAITVHLEREQPDAESIAPPAPPISQPSERKDEAAPVQKPRLRAERPPVSAPEPGVRAPTAPSVQEAPANSAADDAMTSGAPAPAPNRALARAAAETPQQWLERIAELRAQDRQQDADRELAEFKRRYPDYQIPAAMREKVERK